MTADRRGEETLISDVGLSGRQQLIAGLAAVAVALPALAWGWSTGSALPILAGILLGCLIFAWSTVLRVRLSVTSSGLRLRAGVWFSETIGWDAVRQIRTGGRTRLTAPLGRRRNAGEAQYVVGGPTLRVVTDDGAAVISVEDPRAAMHALSAHWPGEHTLRTVSPEPRRAP